MTPSKDISRLIEIMAALRDPETGCPWDQEQTFATIAPYTIEEAYEVADAIARSDLVHLKDELGDLLLQVVYHSRMAEEQGAFAFGDVVEAVTTKMIRRHPHVFGTDAERAAGVTSGFWERAKAAEKAGTERRGVLDDVPAALPALTRAIKLQNKAAKVGFDWPSLAPVFAKLEEEIAELHDAIAKTAASPPSPILPSRRNSATCCSSSPTSRATSNSIPKPPCAPRTRSSRVASATSSNSSPRRDARRRNLTSPRWTPCGTKPKPPSGEAHARRYVQGAPLQQDLRFGSSAVQLPGAFLGTRTTFRRRAVQTVQTEYPQCLEPSSLRVRFAPCRPLPSSPPCRPARCRA